jgi:hypothetical protein
MVGAADAGTNFATIAPESSKEIIHPILDSTNGNTRHYRIPAMLGATAIVITFDMCADGPFLAQPCRGKNHQVECLARGSLG